MGVRTDASHAGTPGNCSAEQPQPQPQPAVGDVDVPVAAAGCGFGCVGNFVPFGIELKKTLCSNALGHNSSKFQGFGLTLKAFIQTV